MNGHKQDTHEIQGQSIVRAVAEVITSASTAELCAFQITTSSGTIFICLELNIRQYFSDLVVRKI